MIGQKIIVTGTSCTGKTTLGKALSEATGFGHTDTDDVYFLPNWVEKDRDVFINDMCAFADSHDQWIVSGSFQTLLKDTLYRRADTIIWLDLPLSIILRRYLSRTYRRVVHKEKCCGENYETLGHVLFKDNMLKHIFKTYGPRKERLKAWKSGVFADKNWIVPTSTEEVEQLLSRVTVRKSYGEVLPCA